jgi:hypothetical protein
MHCRPLKILRVKLLRFKSLKEVSYEICLDFFINVQIVDVYSKYLKVIIHGIHGIHGQTLIVFCRFYANA